MAWPARWPFFSTVTQKKNLGRVSNNWLFFFVDSLATNVVIDLVSPKIDNWGHAGGLAGGVLVAYLLGPRFVIDRPAQGPAIMRDRPPMGLLAAVPTNISFDGF